MTDKTSYLIKALVITITLLFVNLGILSNYNTAIAAPLTSGSLQPDLGFYWVYEINDNMNGYVFEYNISFKEENIIKVKNENTSVLVLEGDGKIIQWPDIVVSPNENDFYIKKVINKNNLELITYRQDITLGFYVGNNYTTAYTHDNFTYSYLELTKPDNITMGSKWTRRVERQWDLDYKKADNNSGSHSIEEIINSTFLCDRMISVKVPAGTFDTFLIIERQWMPMIKGNTTEYLNEKTIEYYYSTKAKGIVKKVQKDLFNTVELTEKLIDYGISKESGNGDPDPNGEEDNKDGLGAWIDLSDINVQISLGVICLIVTGLFFGYFSFRNTGESEKKEKPESNKKPKTEQKKKRS